MSNTKILVTALLTYIVVCIAGGAAYYYYAMMAPPPAMEEAEAKPQAPAPPPPGESPEEAARNAEAAQMEAREREAREQERQKLRQQAAQREREMARLEGSMLKQKNGSLTIYSYPKDSTPPSGLYLRPSLVVGHRVRLQYELYYYYNIYDGGGTAWIFGDRFLIKAGGQNYEFILNPEKRQKGLAPDAEWLSERYTGIADEAWLTALRAVSAAGYGTMTYYQQGGKSISAELSGEAYREIRDMVALYDLNLNQQAAEDE